MTTTSIKLATATAITLGVAGFFTGSAMAAPMLDPAVAHTSDLGTAKPENVRWVCGPYRCWWRPGPPVGFYGPGWGWRRPGWGWRRPGWGPGWGRPGWGRPGWGPGWHGGWRRW